MIRKGITARVFGLAAILGLAASGGALPGAASTFLLLCAIAALACVPQPTPVGQRAVPIIEGALVGLTLASTGSVSQPLVTRIRDEHLQLVADRTRTVSRGGGSIGRLPARDAINLTGDET